MRRQHYLQTLPLLIALSSCATHAILPARISPSHGTAQMRPLGVSHVDAHTGSVTVPGSFEHALTLQRPLSPLPSGLVPVLDAAGDLDSNSESVEPPPSTPAGDSVWTEGEDVSIYSAHGQGAAPPPPANGSSSKNEMLRR